MTCLIARYALSCMGVVAIGLYYFKSQAETADHEVQRYLKSRDWIRGVISGVKEKLSGSMNGNTSLTEKQYNQHSNYTKTNNCYSSNNESNASSFFSDNGNNCKAEWKKVCLGLYYGEMRKGYDCDWKTIETKWIEGSESIWTETRTKLDATVERTLYASDDYQILKQLARRGDDIILDIGLLCKDKQFTETYQHSGLDPKLPFDIVPLLRTIMISLQKQAFAEVVEKTLFLSCHVRDIHGFIEIIKPQLPSYEYLKLMASINGEQA